MLTLYGHNNKVEDCNNMYLKFYEFSKIFDLFLLMGSIKNWNVSLALEEVERNQKQKLKKELKQYWKDVLLLLQKPPDGSNLHNIARKDYEVKNLIVPENIEDPEQKVSLNL